jgi:hypothetical protein
MNRAALRRDDPHLVSRRANLRGTPAPIVIVPSRGTMFIVPMRIETTLTVAIVEISTWTVSVSAPAFASLSITVATAI